MKLTRLPVVLILALALLGGRMVVVPGTSAEANPDDGKTECVADCGHEAAPVDDGKKDDGGDDDAGPVVTITGGTVTSDTTIDISANGGTAISDASGGDGNIAVTTDIGGDVDVDGDGIVDGDGDIAAAGNGGTADASADGGAVAVGDINSGGNNGGVIVVGDVGAPAPEAPKPEAPKPVAPKPEAPKPVAPKPTYPDAKPDAPKVVVVTPKGGKDNGGGGNAGGNNRADRVRGLPATGAGMVQGETDVNGALIALATLGALGAAGYGLRRRFA